MRMSSIDIWVESDGFPARLALAPSGFLRVSWDDILWSAVTVGRPSWYYVFRHGRASTYEALFRWSILRMAVEQRGNWAHQLSRTAAAGALDPTEKGAVSYFLGMTFCKLVASRLLNIPWMLHVDVARSLLGFPLAGRSRPDLIGQDLSRKRWHAFECKGRASTPEAVTKGAAKSQAQRIVTVGGMKCDLHVGAITYFKNGILQFYWRDPPASDEPLAIPLDDSSWRHYWAPVLELLRSNTNDVAAMLSQPTVVKVEQADVSVGVYPPVLRALLNERWELARQIALERFADEKSQLDRFPPYQVDGIAIIAGPSWRVALPGPTG